MAKKENLMILRSIEIEDEGDIPREYTCDGSNKSPSFEIRNIPAGVKSLVLVLNDLSAHAQGKFNHWIVWNIPAIDHIDEGRLPSGSVEGINDFGEKGYVGPCPILGEHKYEFRLFALSVFLDVFEDALMSDIIEEMDGFILAESRIVCKYKREDITAQDYY